jgi:hypothetical protein
LPGLVICYIAIENGPVEIVDLPMKNVVIFQFAMLVGWFFAQGDTTQKIFETAHNGTRPDSVVIMPNRLENHTCLKPHGMFNIYIYVCV